MRCSLPLAPLVLLLLRESPARAERAHAALTLEYAPGPLAALCPEEKLLHDEIGRRIGYDPFDSASAEWFFSEHIALNGYADLRVSTRNPTELRASLDHRIAWSSSRPSPGLGFGLVVTY